MNRVLVWNANNSATRFHIKCDSDFTNSQTFVGTHELVLVDFIYNALGYMVLVGYPVFVIKKLRKPGKEKGSRYRAY